MPRKYSEFKRFLNKADKLKVALFFNLIFSVVLQVIAITLDIVSLFQVQSDASIAFIQFDQTGYYNDLTIAYTCIASLYALLLIGILFLVLVKEDFQDFVIIHSLSTFFLYPTKEILFYLVITCFRQNLGYLITRVVFNFFFIPLILSPHFRLLNLVRIKKKFRQLYFKVSYFFYFGLFSVVLILSFLINIGLLVRINPIDQRLEDVSIGLFNDKEINQIERMEYKMDDSFKFRKLVQYSKVVENSKFLASQCDQTSNFPNCTSLFGYSFSIKCDDENRKFLLDCVGSKSLDLAIISYRDSLSGNERFYPSFNCAIRKSNDKCSRECPNLLKYNLYFIKYVNEKLMPAWNGFHTCSKNQTTRFVLKRNPSIRICQSSFVPKQPAMVNPPGTETQFPPLTQLRYSVKNNQNPYANQITHDLFHQFIQQNMLTNQVNNKQNTSAAKVSTQPPKRSRTFTPIPENESEINEINDDIQAKPKTNVSKFISNKEFPQDLRAYLKLQNEIKRCKPSIKILNAYVNNRNQLIIRTNCEESARILQDDWTPTPLSMSCDILLKQVERKKNLLEKKANKHITNFTRVESAAPQASTTNQQIPYGSFPVTNLILFIVNILKEFNTIHEAIYESPEQLSKIVSNHFGQNYEKFIEKQLSKESAFEEMNEENLYPSDHE
ncbi:hypothetical protein BpHYR1_001979 [Brachionus plicatilis]|uniref:Transmembrane protein n=1 Tax=Brachionus plicatilis TaxID=10195 RepID=A0A3M7R8B6_BRAPC|nr:hypothetical protein BpHYR1_001979 [Brachionus plicatilis]